MARRRRYLRLLELLPAPLRSLLAGEDSRLARAAPWLALAALTAAVTAPLLLEERMFLRELEGDSIVTVWYYNLITASLPDLPTHLIAFDWPNPHPRTAEFPAYFSALLAAPWFALLGWQQGFAVTQASAVAVAVGGAALMARGLGARGSGILVAGGLALFTRNLWFTVHASQLNAAWPGLALGALGALLWQLEPELPRARRVALAVTAALLGWLASEIYPPTLAFLAPAGAALFLLSGRLRPRALAWVAAAVLPVLIYRYAGMMEMAASRPAQDCGACFDALHAVDLRALALTRDPGIGFTRPGFYLTSWIGLPLVLLHAGRLRLAAAALALAPLVLLSLGSCPQLGGEPVAALRTLESLKDFWCGARSLSDLSRAATAAALAAGVLAGVGLEALRPRWARLLTAALLLGPAGWLTVSELERERNWTPVSPPPAGRFLADAPAGAAVELPYDQSAQFLSALTAPNRPRVNPLKRGHTPAGGEELVWLNTLGGGALPDAAPLETLVAHDIRWVLYEPGRCAGISARCPEGMEGWLRETFGEPRAYEDGALLIWEVGGSGG